MTIDGSGAALPADAGGGDDWFFDTPNCPRCLSRMEPDETAAGRVHWACSACGFAAVA